MKPPSVFAFDVHVFAHANDKWSIVFNMIRQPLVTDKLSVSQQEIDRRGLEYTKKPLDQVNAMWRRTVARMVQKRPHQKILEPTHNDGQNQNIDIGLSEFPVGPDPR